MNRSRELVVGFWIVFGVAIMVFGTLWLQGSNFGRAVTEVDVLVSNVGLLAEGDAVKFRGVTVGRVGRFSITAGGEAVRIQLLLDGEVGLAEDAVVLLSAESLFGGGKADIVSRSAFPSYAFYEPRPSDQEGGVKVLGGYAMPDLTQLTAVAQEVAENMAVLTNRFDEAFGEETAQNLARAIDNLEQLTSTLNAVVEVGAKDVTRIADQIRVSAEEIATTLTAARGAIERVDNVLATGVVDSIFSNTNELTENFREASADVSVAAEQLVQTLVRADSAMARLDRLAARVESGEGTIGRLFGDTALAVRAEGVLLRLDLLLADLRENPKKYVRLSIF